MKTEQNLTEFNTRVERLRAVTGQTWAEIAAALEVSRTMLHYYRNGQHPPDAPVLYRLAEAERRTAAPVDGPAKGKPARAALGGLPLASGQHLRWLHDLLRQQQEVIAAAQRHGREIEGWIAEAEKELAQPLAAAAPVPVRRTDQPLPADGDEAAHPHPRHPPRPVRRKEKRAFLKRPVAEQVIMRDIATVSLPIFGQLPAGWPQTRDGVAAQRPARTATVPKGKFPEGAFGLDVRGDSMNAAGPQPILDGDTVVLLPPEQRSPRVGDIVAALIDGETCLKRLVRGGSRRGTDGHHLRSESTNPVHGELYPAHDLVIQGVVVGKL